MDWHLAARVLSSGDAAPRRIFLRWGCGAGCMVDGLTPEVVRLYSYFYFFNCNPIFGYIPFSSFGATGSPYSVVFAMVFTKWRGGLPGRMWGDCMHHRLLFACLFPFPWRFDGHLFRCDLGISAPRGSGG